MGETGMGQWDFGSLAAEVILARLMRISRKPLILKKKTLTQLNKLMGHNVPPYATIQDLKEIQIFCMANNGEDRMIKETQLIIYALVNMKSMGIYGKVMERWHAKDVTECKLWPNVYSFIIAEYKQMLRKSSSTIDQDV